MRICVIDPGIRNFAIGIEDFAVPLIDKDQSFDDMCLNGKIILLELVDLAETTSAKRISVYILKNLTNYLESILPLLSSCSAFVVEKQLKLNPNAQWIEHHCYAFFINHFQSFKVITPFPAKIKYSELKYKGGKKKNIRKKWAAGRASEILSLRGEDKIAEYINSSKKNDDLGDVVIMMQAFKSRVFIKKSFHCQI